MIKRTLGLLPNRELKPAKMKGIRRRILEVMIKPQWQRRIPSSDEERPGRSGNSVQVEFASLD